MRIAVIDDGIEPSLCPNLSPEYDFCVKEDGRVVRREGQILTDHGTTSARIILKYAPTASLCSIQVFDTEELKTSVGQLVAALEWCYREQIPLIHLSLGSTLWLDYEHLRRITARLLQNGQVVVAAHSNSGAYTVPACLMGVLGVLADESLSGGSYYAREAGWDQVQLHASSRHIWETGRGHAFETQVTNSYAAPLVTAKVHGILCEAAGEGWTVTDIYQRLTGQGSTMFRMRPDFIEDAVLFQAGEHWFYEKLFFFSIREKVDSLDGLKEAVRKNPYAPAVLLPSGNQEVDREACQYCWERCRLGFVYAGEAPAGIESGNGGGLFWDEGQYRAFLEHAGHMVEEGFMEDTARILVDGEGDLRLPVAVGLWQRFQEEGYPCIVVSNEPFGYLYGVEYLPESIPPERFAMDAAALRQAAVVIYCLRDKAGLEETGYDFEVSVGEDSGIEMKMEGKRIWLPWNFGDGEWKRLYKYILAYEPDGGGEADIFGSVSPGHGGVNS